jgi:hypothetical protein
LLPKFIVLGQKLLTWPAMFELSNYCCTTTRGAGIDKEALLPARALWVSSLQALQTEIGSQLRPHCPPQHFLKTVLVFAFLSLPGLLLLLLHLHLLVMLLLLL